MKSQANARQVHFASRSVPELRIEHHYVFPYAASNTGVPSFSLNNPWCVDEKSVCISYCKEFATCYLAAGSSSWHTLPSTLLLHS